MSKIFKMFRINIGDFIRNPNVSNKIKPLNKELIISRKLYKQDIKSGLMEDANSVHNYFQKINNEKTKK